MSFCTRHTVSHDGVGFGLVRELNRPLAERTGHGDGCLLARIRGVSGTSHDFVHTGGAGGSDIEGQTPHELIDSKNTELQLMHVSLLMAARSCLLQYLVVA